jgi:hypothetical protein
MSGQGSSGNPAPQACVDLGPVGEARIGGYTLVTRCRGRIGQRGLELAAGAVSLTVARAQADSPHGYYRERRQ